MTKTANALIQDLELVPHPEGGWFREVHRSRTQVRSDRGIRPALTTIYYLLERAQLGRWHVVDADEIWHFYEGAPLELFTYDPTSEDLRRTLLAPPSADGVPVAVVPAGVWQGARSLGDHSLSGCSVGPGFEFADFRFVSALPGHEQHFDRTLHPLRDLL